MSKERGRADVEHIGLAHDEAELELLTALARQRIHAGQDELDLGLPATDQSAVEVVGTRMGRPLEPSARCTGGWVSTWRRVLIRCSSSW